MLYSKHGRDLFVGKGENMDYTRDDLAEAKRQIDSTLHKLREVIKTLETKENPKRYRSQITLAQRRVKAFEIAGGLIQNRLLEAEAEEQRNAYGRG